MKSLKEKKISDLSPEEIEARLQFLLTLSDDEILNYLLYVVDNEYSELEASTDSESEFFKKVENFIADKRFKRFRSTILEKIK